ncbi:hypothetical protein BLOT_008875 [Blomia tropicalis]|nr:hypothetical protein BLOT_008875 [Blomia tropicalis]
MNGKSLNQMKQVKQKLIQFQTIPCLPFSSVRLKRECSMFIKKGIEKQIKLRHTIDANAILAKNGKMVEWGMIADRTQSKLPARHAPK